MEQEVVHFGENSIIKSAFNKNKRPLNINEVDIKRIKLSDKKSYGKDSFRYSLLDIDVKVMLFHLHYA